MKATIITKRFIVCPGCGEHEFSIEHLMDKDHVDRKLGPWSCANRGCRTAITFWVRADGSIDLETSQEPVDGYALVKLRDLYMVLREPHGRIEPDHVDYFYHSHQCMQNLLHNLVQVYASNGVADPHGEIRFVANIEDTEEVRDLIDGDVGPGPDLPEIFKLFNTDGEPLADSQYPE